MIQAFDTAAADYDRQFTDTGIGRQLRQRVWDYMDMVLLGSRKAEILELNCGTGEDAVHFARQGHRVLATDISGEMLALASAKIEKADLRDRVDTQQLDMRQVGRVLEPDRKNLVFSNFGGLNCLSRPEVSDLARDLAERMSPGSRFVSVVMGRTCLWESLYFLAKADFRNIFRRNTEESLNVVVSGRPVETWYYDPAELEAPHAPCL